MPTSLKIPLLPKGRASDEKKAVPPPQQPPKKAKPLTVRLASEVILSSDAKRNNQLATIEKQRPEMLVKISEYLSIADRLKLGITSYAMQNNFPIFPYTEAVIRTRLSKTNTVDDQITKDTEMLNGLIRDLSGSSLFETVNANVDPSYCCQARSTGCDEKRLYSSCTIKTCVAYNEGFRKLCPPLYIISCPLTTWQIFSHCASQSLFWKLVVSCSVPLTGSSLLGCFVCCLYLKANGTLDRIDIYVKRKEAEERDPKFVVQIERSKLYLDSVVSLFQERVREIKKPVAPEVSRDDEERPSP